MCLFLKYTKKYLNILSYQGPENALIRIYQTTKIVKDFYESDHLG